MPAIFTAILDEGITTVVELRTSWDLEDVLDSYEQLTIKKYNEHRAYKAASKK